MKMKEIGPRGAGGAPMECKFYFLFKWFFSRKNHVVGDLKVKVSEDKAEAEVVLPGFSFGDLNRFGNKNAFQ